MQTHVYRNMSSSFWGVIPVLSLGAYAMVVDWVFMIVFLTPPVHMFNRICHYCIPLFRDLPEDGHVEVKACRRHIVKWQMIVFDRAIVELNTA
jgi:hypothetical protein